jgi:glutamate 5-kinase
MRRGFPEKVERIVLKLGTGILTDSSKRLDLNRVEQLCAQVVQARKRQLDVVLVTSGAIGTGMGELKLEKRPKALPELQALAAIGQGKLMSIYETVFGKQDITVAQILLTHDDLKNRDRHLNARNTIETLLHHGVIPIINENDTVSVAEIRFGDNDRLAALVASLIKADLLIILTSVDGLYENFDGKSGANVGAATTPRPVPLVQEITPKIQNLAGGTTSATSVGGMVSKLDAAKVVSAAGIPLIIANGLKADTLACVLDGEEVGTLFAPKASGMKSRKRWIAFFHKPKGTILVDDGAKLALVEGSKSLLAAGVRDVWDDFAKGDVISIRDVDGSEFARGITGFSAAELKGLRGQKANREVVHRDDLVIL